MFEQALPANTKKILALLAKSSVVKKAYLAGGTALALQLGHRLSYDLDFFSEESFAESDFLSQMKDIPGFKLEKIAQKTILGKFSGVRFSLFHYEYPLLSPVKKFNLINVADLRDIAAMKIAAVASRGTKRDFIDLYFIGKEAEPLEKVLQLYDKKYKNLATTSMHILKSMVYFEDAESDEMPKMLKKVSWLEVKAYFEKEINKLRPR